MRTDSIKYSRIKMHNNNPLFEGLEKGDLARLVHTVYSIDEFRSKMGDDADIIVLAFVVDDKNPAQDLMNFVERGYDFVLDADVSGGEAQNGEYMVFVELERNEESAENIHKLISDITNLTDTDMAEWEFRYQKNPTKYDCSEENIKRVVPLTARRYRAKFGGDEDLDAMREAARVPMKSISETDKFRQSIQIAAGIK